MLEVSQIIPIRKPSLPPRVSLLISSTEILLFPSVSQYVPMVALKNPSSVTISSVHLMAFHTRTRLFEQNPSSVKCTRDCSPLFGKLLFFSYFARVLSYHVVSSLLIEHI